MTFRQAKFLGITLSVLIFGVAIPFGFFPPEIVTILILTILAVATGGLAIRKGNRNHIEYTPEDQLFIKLTDRKSSFCMDPDAASKYIKSLSRSKVLEMLQTIDLANAAFK